MTPAEYLMAQAKAMTEDELLARVLGTPRRPGVALALGWLGYHTHRSQHSPAGFPDLALVRRGRFVLAELKRQGPRYKTTPAQDRWLTELGRVADIDGVDNPRIAVYLWRPIDLLDGTITRLLA